MRYERKYIASGLDRNDLDAFLHSNSYTKPYPERKITSIYYDTPDYKFYFNSEDGISNRNKIRIRYYNDCFENVILENKVRYSEIGFKEILTFGKNIKADKDQLTLELLHNFLDQPNPVIPKTLNDNLFPTLIVQYKRDYYCDYNYEARVTFDYNIRFSKIDLYKGDFVKPYFLPFGKSIIEVKYDFDNNIQPQILTSLSSQFNLTISRCSKYCIGLNYFI